MNRANSSYKYLSIGSQNLNNDVNVKCLSLHRTSTPVKSDMCCGVSIKVCMIVQEKTVSRCFKVRCVDASD